MNNRSTASRSVSVLGIAVIVVASGAAAYAQTAADFVPVTDAMLQAPAPEDWLTWRRTTDSWGFRCEYPVRY